MTEPVLSMPAPAFSASPAQREWAWLLVSTLSAYMLVDSLYVGIPGFQRALFGGILLSALAGAAALFSITALRTRDLVFAFAVLMITVGGLTGAMTQTIFYPFYFAGDLATLVLMFLFLILGPATGRSLFSRSSIWLLAVVTVSSSLLSPFLGIENGRYDPPSPFALGLTLGLVFIAPSRIHAFIGMAVLLVLAVLAYYSGFRTHFGLASLGLVIAFARLLSPRLLLVGLIVAIVGVSINLASIGGLLVDQAVVNESRFRDLAAGEADQSVLERALEVRDAWQTARESWSPWQWVFGAGHGATYVPTESYIVRNITADNRVHNIHVGPMLLLYRYGFAGILAFAAILLAVLRRVWEEYFAPRDQLNFSGVFTWIMAFYLADFLVRNVMIDPLFAYSLAGFASLHLQNRDARTSSTSERDRAAATASIGKT